MLLISSQRAFRIRLALKMKVSINSLYVGHCPSCTSQDISNYNNYGMPAIHMQEVMKKGIQALCLLNEQEWAKLSSIESHIRSCCTLPNSEGRH